MYIQITRSGILLCFFAFSAYATSITLPYSFTAGSSISASQMMGNFLSITSALSSTVSSPWVASSSNIYFNAGSVGIGSSAPTHALDVNGTIKYNNYAFYFSGTPNAAITIGNPIVYTSYNATLPYTTIVNGFFQAPVSGLYFFTAGVNTVSSSGAFWRAGIFQSSSLAVSSIPFASFNAYSFIATSMQEVTSATFFSANMSAVAFCNAGDYIRVFAVPLSGASQTNYSWGNYNNFLNGYLISQ